MSPSVRPRRRVLDILENIERIERYCAGLDRAAFERDTRTMDAVERCLARISEAAVKLGDLAETLAPGPDWRGIRGIGNVLRHGYDTVEPIQLWAIVTTDLPVLRAACRRAGDELARRDGEA